MKMLEQLANAGIIPVVILENAADAIPTAKALLAGGIDVMEITFRTTAAVDAIQFVAECCPDMLVGAGTIVTLEQCKRAVEAGAKFIVSPGFDCKIVEWCLKNHITVIPGCVTPSEIMNAMDLGLHVVKFFPANVYGGLMAMKTLVSPFRTIKFIPTGGINVENVGEYIAMPFVHAVGGSWLCPKSEVAAGNFGKITTLCLEARKNLLGYEIAHIGINAANKTAAAELAGMFKNMFNFAIKDGNSSIFASRNIEIMKSTYRGACGHLAVHTDCIEVAIADLAKKGFLADMSTAKYSGEQMIAVYLQREIGGFAIHLLQK